MPSARERATMGGVGQSSTLPDRLTQLARATSELVRADTVAAVSTAVVTHGAAAVEATAASLMLLSDDRSTLDLVASAGGSGADTEVVSVPMTASTPAAEAVRCGRRIIVNDEARTVVALPLATATRTIGAIVLGFSDERDLEASELEFLEILADTCAQSLDRLDAQAAAATQTAKLTFLAEAASELAASLDYEATLTSVARLAVPAFADWCAIDLVDDDRLRRLAVAHVDPAKVQLAHDLAERYPADPEAEHGAWQVMRTGQSELIPEISDEMIAAGAVDDEHLKIALALRLRSAVTVPLIARGRVLGVITWVTAESERRYTEGDLALAEDLAKRAAVSLDNADLHSQTLAAAVELQHAVLPQSLPTSPAWEVAHQYLPSGRTEVGGDFYDVVDLGDGRLVMFVGDVMGRGVAAAAAMAQMRAAVRAYAALDPDPAVVLTRLDQMYARYQAEQLVTLVYALADPSRDELLIGNAGHPPPVVVRGDGSPTSQLPFAEGAPLGVTAPEPRGHRVVPFYSGDTVVMFTDGLIERRDEDITDGQDRLVHALAALTGVDLTEGALGDLVALLRDPSRDDDVAVLAVRRSDVGR